MGKIALSLDQNIRSSIVFLEMFGLFLEKTENVNLGETLKIVDSTTSEVGSVLIEQEKISISAQTALGNLEASYKPTLASGFVDIESQRWPRFANWNTNIDYSINENQSSKIIGRIGIDCSMDDEFGIRCLCRPLLECWENDNKRMSLLFQRDGKTFGLDFTNGEYRESIELRPFDSMNGYLLHTIKAGEYDKEKGGYPFRKFSGVLQKSEVERGKLRTLNYTEEYDETIDVAHYSCDKTNKEYGKEDVVQMGLLMKTIDPDMYEKIAGVKKLLTAGNISLLDSFVNASLGSFSDVEVFSLLGIQRQPKKSVSETYFGLGNQFKLKR